MPALKERISRCVQDILPNLPHSAIKNMILPLQHIVDNKERHKEHLLQLIKRFFKYVEH